MPLHLVDFGFTTKFVHHTVDESDGVKRTVHKGKELQDVFRGNMVFSSLNQLQFMTTSRRDDLISLCYLLVFLLNGGELPGMQIYDQTNNKEAFRKIR